MIRGGAQKCRKLFFVCELPPLPSVMIAQHRMARLWWVFGRPSCHLVSSNLVPLDEVVLSKVRRVTLPNHPNRTPAPRKFQRLWKLGKSSIASRPAPGEIPTHRTELEEYEQSIDKHHESSNASGSPRGKSRWLPRYKSHPTRNRHDRPNSLPGETRYDHDGCTGWRF
jgi:hypothetical protein